MPSERMQQRIDAFLDEADDAASANEWTLVADKARAALVIDPENTDAATFLQMAVANGVSQEAVSLSPARITSEARTSSDGEPASSVIEAAAIVADLEAASAAGSAAAEDPESFAGGRYRVLRFLGEGGKKLVYLAHDALLDRDIAFSLIKTDGLDDVGRERIMREAQAMGRLAHQNIVAIYDIGEHTAADGSTQPFLVQELMGGGDVEDLLKEAEGALPLQQALDIALATARGLEFAHAQDVIHRDLKPGNVWLTADGVAKIGDLGLAVTLGQSRLTSHGMMVGTYGYMPPEQALGQEVTPQADLYSLGAMLYELVTGRPPFQGDTPTAVISQHLNTQPVAPSWHSDHCPPDLEALILHLLAKVPEDRPASASEVIAVLEGIDPEGQSASHSDSGANPLDRLARGVFVGRERELELLRGALDGAIEGRGSVAMLVGEPGIGKTRTVQELETYARMRGANVYWGRTHESSGMPAYWPWLQVGRAWGAEQDFSAAATVAAVANPQLVRLFPELRQAVPTLPEPPKQHDQSTQFLLFDAYTQFIRAQSAATPWVIVLDDLHWADQPTLQVLQFMARELANMNVLIVGTYRDTDLVRTHPLSEALAELNRAGGFQRVVLKGLDESEVASYVRQRAAVDPSPALLSRVYEETEGNPFFLSEIVNLLTDEGTLSATDSVSDIALPDGVREALGRRLDRLSEETNELLQVGAIVGREFAYDTLSLLEEHDGDELLRLIEEALDARVIEENERAGRYRFTHALMQETLLDELSTTRRVRLHGEVAEALERRWGDRADEFATRLAAHYLESATLTSRHAEQAFHYSKLAAEAARSQSGWSEAARYYQQCVTLLTEAEVELGEDAAELLVALGVCARNAADHRTAWRSLMQAIAVCRERGDAVGQAAATLETVVIFAPPGRHLALVREAVAALDGTDPQLEALLLGGFILTGSIMGGGLPREEVPATLARVRELEAAYPQDEVEAYLLFYDALQAFETSAFDDADRALSEAFRLFDRLGAVPVTPGLGASGALCFLARIPLMRGELERAEEASVSAFEYARRVDVIQIRDIALDCLMTVASLRCDYERFDSLERQSERGLPVRLMRAQLAEMRGSAAEAVADLPDDTYIGGSTTLACYVAATRTRMLMSAGQTEQAAEEFSRCVALFDEVPRPEDGSFGSYHVTTFLELDQSLATFGDESLVRAVSARLIADGTRASSWGAHSVDHLLGRLALSLGEVDEAERHFRTGLEWCERERCPIEGGRNLQGLAEVEQRRGDLEEAREHLDAAGALFSRHGAKLYLDQVIAKKEILKA